MLAAVFMVIIFGLLALQRIPIQLAPDVNKPVISVLTNWPGGSPYEIEREILNRQEEKLRGIEGLVETEGTAQDGRAEIKLQFALGTNMTARFCSSPTGSIRWSNIRRRRFARRFRPPDSATIPSPGSS